MCGCMRDKKKKIKDELPASALCTLQPDTHHPLNRQPWGTEAAEAAAGWSRFQARPAQFIGGMDAAPSKNGGFALAGLA